MQDGRPWVQLGHIWLTLDLSTASTPIIIMGNDQSTKEITGSPGSSTTGQASNVELHSSVGPAVREAP